MFKERIVNIVVRADELCRATRLDSEEATARRQAEEASHRETADCLHCEASVQKKGAERAMGMARTVLGVPPETRARDNRVPQEILLCDVRLLVQEGASGGVARTSRRE